VPIGSTSSLSDLRHNIPQTIAITIDQNYVTSVGYKPLGHRPT